MFDINATLLSLKHRAWEQFYKVDREINALIEKSIEIGNCETLRGKISKIGLENIELAISLRENLHNYINNSCLFFHGSTAIGAGHIAPNLVYQLVVDDDNHPELHVKVVPNCRDDLDMFLIVEDTIGWENRVYSAFRKLNNDGIDITLNLISQNAVWQELVAHGTPALRRIFLYKHPKCLAGNINFEAFKRLALSNISQYDLPHEIDFRLLMCVSKVMNDNAIKEYTFKTPDLILLFPTLYLSWRNNLRIDFPHNRLKLKNNNAVN